MSNRLTELLAHPTLDDLMAGVFVGTGRRTLPSNRACIHEFFQEFSQRDDLPEDFQAMMSDVSFSAGDWYPFSREVEAALMRLQIGRLVSMNNPDYRSLTISVDQEQRIRTSLERLPGEDREFISQAAKEFRDAVEHPEADCSTSE